MFQRLPLIRFSWITCLGLLALPVLPSSASAAGPEEELWAAARNGDARAIEASLAKGANINAPTSFGATALWFAAYKGKPDIVRLLLKKGANPNVRDRVWGESPLMLSAEQESAECMTALLEAGASGADASLIAAAANKKAPIVQALLDKGKISADAKSAALAATPDDAKSVVEILRKSGATPWQGPSTGAGKDSLAALAGSYESQQGPSVKVTVKDGLVVTNSRWGTIVFKPDKGDSFTPIAESGVTLKPRLDRGRLSGLALRRGDEELVCDRAETVQLPKPSLAHAVEKRVPVQISRDWPSFRGVGASGVADGQHPPTVWDAEKGINVLWKTAIPGVAHSCPIVSGSRVFVTTAVSSDAKAAFKTGQYGAGTTSKDFSLHSWRIYCLDKTSGKVLWEREVHHGVPRVDRHEKATQANATPCTDGEHLAVVFGSEGLFCYDLGGNRLWKQDLGVLDLGAFNDPDLKWGAGSSPIVWNGLVIVQCDRPKDGFLAAFDVKSGSPVWRTPRDEPPSWATPTVIESAGHTELVANGSRFIRGYDPRTGKELWRCGPNSEITVPTPFAADGLIFVTNGYRPIQPIYAILPGARGDLSTKGSGSGANLAWETTRGGPYLPTPIVYGPYLYVCTNLGILTAYDARTGRQIYKRRLGGGGGYTASPVAADGRIYFACEDGEVRVVKAGSEFELLSINPIGEPCLATPAIADGMFLVRARGHVYAFAATEGHVSNKEK